MNKKLNRTDNLIAAAAGNLAPDFHQFLLDNDRFMETLHELTSSYVETLEVFTEETVSDVAVELVMRVCVRLDD